MQGDDTNREVPNDPLERSNEEGYALDELARGLAASTLSRRQALKLVGAAILGGALGIFSFSKGAEARVRCFHCTSSAQCPGPFTHCNKPPSLPVGCCTV